MLKKCKFKNKIKTEIGTGLLLWEKKNKKKKTKKKKLILISCHVQNVTTTGEVNKYRHKFASAIVMYWVPHLTFFFQLISTNSSYRYNFTVKLNYVLLSLL